MISPELVLALATTEQRASATTFAVGAALDARLEKAPTPADAVRRAVGISAEGKRASAVLLPSEVLGAVEAIAAAARGRAPITVHVAGTPKRPCAGRDEIAAALDLGAGVIVTWSAQDGLDAAVAAHRAAEDGETPFLVVHDAGYGPFEPLAANLVARFLGARRNGTGPAPGDVAQKRAERGFASRAPFALGSALREVGDATGRSLAAVERADTADAEEVIVAVGSAFPVACRAAQELRGRGRRAGVLGIRVLRPFYAADVVKALARAKAIGVIEPLDVALAPCGPVAAALKAAFADALTWAQGFPGVGHIPPIASAGFATFEAEPRTEDALRVFDEIALRDRARRTLVFGSDVT